VHYPTRAKLYYEENEHRAEEQIINRQEISRPDLVGMVVQECAPILIGLALGRVGFADSAHVLLDSTLAHMDVELEQFTSDALCSPQPVCHHHFFDPLYDLGTQLWLASNGPGLLPPEKAKALPVPAKESIRLYDKECPLPRLKPTGQQYQQGSVSIGQLWPIDLTAEDNQLLAQ